MKQQKHSELTPKNFYKVLNCVLSTAELVVVMLKTKTDFTFVEVLSMSKQAVALQVLLFPILILQVF